MKDRYYKDVVFSLGIFFLLIISVNILFYPEMPGFIGIAPHPYLIVILLMSGRFGLKEGLIAALIACMILGVYIMREYQPFFTWRLFLDKPYLLAFVSFFLAAFVVGEMRGFNKSYERTLVRENHELKQEKARLNEQLEIVTQIKEELENRIIGQEETVHSLYQAIKALETLEEQEFFQALTRLTCRFTGADKVSLYIIDYSNDSLQLVARHGWEGQFWDEEKLPLYEGMFGQVLKNNLLLTIKEISDNPEQLQIWEKCPHKAYAYVPISMASVTVGILTIDDITFLKLNVSTVRILSLIAELAVPALKNIITYQDLQEMVKIDPVTEMLKYESFLAVAEVEFKKAIRYDLHFSIVALEVDGLKEIEESYGHDARIETLKWISKTIKGLIRNVDASGMAEKEGQFLLALPVTNTEGILAVIDRMRNRMEKSGEEIGQYHSSLRFYYGAASYHPSIETIDAMIKMAQNSLALNRSSKDQREFLKKKG